MAKDRSGRFVQGASLFAIATIGAKVIGAVYRIPLTNILGAEGMGLYQLVFPLYALILTLSSGAMPSAISIITSRSLVNNQADDSKRWLSTAMTIVLIMGGAFSVVMLLLAYPLAIIQKNTSITIGYIAIAPAVFFVSGIAVLRGWFQGNKNMRPTSLSNLVEAVFKLGVGLTLAYVFRIWGTQYAVMGALIGVSVSELATFVVLYIIYRKKYGKLYVSTTWEERRVESKRILAVSVPMAICGIIANLTQFLDSVIVVRFLTYLGVAVEEATASYGIFSGPVASLISLPIVLGTGLSVAIVPAVAGDREGRRISPIKAKITTAIKLSLVIGIPFATLFFVESEGIIRLLYPAFSLEQVATASTLLKISSVSTFTLLMGQIVSAILQALGYIAKPIKNYTIGAITKVTLDLALMPLIGIYGVAVASVVSGALSLVLNLASLVYLTGTVRGVIKTALCAIISSLATAIVMLCFVLLDSTTVGTIVGIVVGCVTYVVCLIASRGLDRQELASLPFGAFIVDLSYKIRFWD